MASKEFGITISKRGPIASFFFGPSKVKVETWKDSPKGYELVPTTPEDVYLFNGIHDPEKVVNLSIRANIKTANIVITLEE